jgi:RNA polymerase primary sigma factor
MICHPATRTAKLALAALGREGMHSQRQGKRSRSPTRETYPLSGNLSDDHTAEFAKRSADRFSRSSTRLATAARIQRVMSLPLEFIPSAEFEREDAERIIMTDMPPSVAPRVPVSIPRGLPAYLASLYEIPLLTREQELHLFRKFNYLKFKAAQLRDRLASRSSPRVLRQIEQLYAAAINVKNRIVRANLRLVVALARRYGGQGNDLWELVSDGNVSLMRAVEKFDYARGNKMSTYASWAIIRNFARSIPAEQRHSVRFRTGQEEILSSYEDGLDAPSNAEAAQQTRESVLRSLMPCLSDREQYIVSLRFGLAEGREPLTLEEIGKQLGVSKERVRQIVVRSLNKLRQAAQENRVEFLEVL